MFNYLSRRPAQGGAQRNDSARGANGAPPIHELGGMLRKRREAMGATLGEVEAATKIRQKYIAALEADEWALLPGEVVGRGFLRNYATYLGLDANELIERRRAVADPLLASALAGTSATSSLPPVRQVDYRPKDVPLHEEQDGIEQRSQVRLGPILAVVGMVLALVLLIATITVFGGQIVAGAAGLIDGVQRWAGAALEPATPTPTATTQALISAPTATATTPPTQDESDAAPDAGNPPAILVPTNTPASDQPAAEPPAEPATPTPAVAEEPVTAPPTPTDTATPEVVEPPTPTPTDTPEETPTPEPPVVVAPACPDARSVISAPGVNAVVAGNVAVTGRATHEVFEYYKLEYAPGADAADGFFYFGGANSQVEGGQLGVFSSSAVANGVYTIRLTVVDQTGNFPPPCQVTVTVQN